MSGYGYGPGHGYGYGYVRRDYTSYREPRADNWNKPSYGGSSYDDHVCRPVIIDSEGRKTPIVSYAPTNSQSYGTKERTTEEHVHTPVVVTEYEIISPTKMDGVKDYGIASNGWGRPSSPVYDRPQKVEEVITTIQTEVSRPSRTGLSWRNTTPNSTGYNVTPIYGQYDSVGNSDWKKPSGNTTHDESYDYYYRRNNILKEPTMIKKEGWERQSPNGWVARPTYETPMSKPTNDIDAAVEYLKEAAKSMPLTPAPGTVLQPRLTSPAVSTVPQKTIDSKEAQRRYGNFNQPAREETYTGTIDSTAAAKKYRGTPVEPK